MSSSSRDEVRRRAVWSLRAEVRHVARDVFGAVLIETPVPGFRLLTRSGLDDPLAGVRAAVLARDVAASELLGYVEAARGAGRSWDDIGAAVGVDAAGGEPRGELAFALLIERRPLPEPERSLWRDQPRARWTCASCEARVVDDGPYTANPADNETGHAPGCARHAEEVAAYRATWDDEQGL